MSGITCRWSSSVSTVALDRAAAEIPGGFEYDREGDVLDLYFGEKRRAWTIELTENITIGIDRQAETVVSLGFLDFSQLARPTDSGPRSFPVTGLAQLTDRERELVFRLITSPPVSKWLDVSTVELLPDSPFAVVHLEALAVELGEKLSAAA
jgi:hypothetical protein